MKGRTVKTQKTVFEKVDRTLSVTIDESKISYTREGVKFLPAGVPLGADDGSGNKIDLLLNRSQKVELKNDANAMGYLTHDIYLDHGDEAVTICFDGVAYIDEIEAALTEVVGSSTTLAGATKTAVPNVSYKKV